MRPPRAIHPLGFEFGQSLGKPHDKKTKRKVLEAALAEIPERQEPGNIYDAHFPSYLHYRCKPIHAKTTHPINVYVSWNKISAHCRDLVSVITAKLIYFKFSKLIDNISYIIYYFVNIISRGYIWEFNQFSQRNPNLFIIT